MRSAIVFGGTGLVGSHLVKLLCDSDEYVSVTAIARRKLDFAHPKLTVKLRSLDELEQADIEYADEIFCCLGTTQKKAGTRAAFEKVDVEYPLQIASLAKKCGIQHYIVITAMGANEQSPFYYNRVKGKLEKELIALDLPQLSIVRPSLLVGERQEFRLGEKMGEFVLKALNPLMIGSMRKYRFIPAAQLALAMKVIALAGKIKAVNVYESVQLNELKMREPEEQTAASGEVHFNWDKLNEPGLAPLDEEVVFNQEKLNSLKVKKESQ